MILFNLLESFDLQQSVTSRVQGHILDLVLSRSHYLKHADKRYSQIWLQVNKFLFWSPSRSFCLPGLSLLPQLADLNNCLQDIQSWMAANVLQLNEMI